MAWSRRQLVHLEPTTLWRLGHDLLRLCSLLLLSSRNGQLRLWLWLRLRGGRDATAEAGGAVGPGAALVPLDKAAHRVIVGLLLDFFNLVALLFAEFDKRLL